MELYEQREKEAIVEAIKTYYISPGLISKVMLFAVENRTSFTKFDGATGLFHFSDGEAYTGEAILGHFGIEAPKNIFMKKE